jgi:hypothetical protein
MAFFSCIVYNKDIKFLNNMSFIEDGGSRQQEESADEKAVSEQLRQIAELGDHPQEAEVSAEEIAKGAQSLEQGVRKKTWGEKHFSEYQTRKAKIRGTEHERGDAFRWERGQIYKAYMLLRKEIQEAEEQGLDATVKRELLKQMRERVKVITKDLDKLNLQYFENVKTVTVETEYGTYEMPVAELDLGKTSEGEPVNPDKDDRVPDFFIGSIATNFHKSACFGMARALQGHKVYVPMYPEQDAVKKPEDFQKKVSEAGNFKPHAEIFKGTIKQLGLEKYNLVGYSMGSAVALEMASDPELEGMNDFTVMEPLGIKQKGFMRLAFEFGVSQGLARSAFNKESMIKTFDQGQAQESRGDRIFFTDANILAQKLYTPDRIAKAKRTGRFQVWMGDDSPLVDKRRTEEFFREAGAIQQEGNPASSPVEIYKVKGADHGVGLVHSLGISRMMDGQAPGNQVNTVTDKELGNSTMEWILRDIANKE